jgi:hypothetical protein
MAGFTCHAAVTSREWEFGFGMVELYTRPFGACMASRTGLFRVIGCIYFSLMHIAMAGNTSRFHVRENPFITYFMARKTRLGHMGAVQRKGALLMFFDGIK